MSKRILCALLCATFVLGVSGCSAMESPTVEIKKETTPFTAEEIAANRVTTMTQAERENLVYSYVSNSIKVDSKNLIAVEKDDAIAIEKKIDEINKGLLSGKITNKDKQATVQAKAETSTVAEVEQKVEPDVISDSIANYMLYNFTNTPYTWKMSECNIAGMDPATHLFFVDIVYKTTNEKKVVLPESSIVHGQLDEQTLLAERFAMYMSLMEKQTQVTASASPTVQAEYQNLKKEFEEKFGTVDDIVKTIKDDKPIERIEKYKTTGNAGIGAVAYSGVNNTHELGAGTMTWRFVLGYNYTIGEVNQLQVKAAYLYGYERAGVDELLTKFKSDEITGKEVLDPLVNKLVFAYNKAVDECDHKGLWGMFKSYRKYDTEYEDYDNYAYHKLGSYLYDVIGRDGNKLYVKLTLNNKERTKGSAMSEAIYKDEKLMTIEITDEDKLKIIDVLPLNREIIGEPISVIEKVNGISDQLLFTEGTFTDTNDKQIREVLKNFMQLEMTKNFDSTAFKSCIDIGISTSALEEIKKNIEAVDADEVITWLTGYSTKSNIYVSVILREVYRNNQTHQQNETQATIDLVHRTNGWYVVSYNRTMNAKLSGGNITETNCLEHYLLKDGKITSIKKDVAKVEETSTTNKS